MHMHGASALGGTKTSASSLVSRSDRSHHRLRPPTLLAEAVTERQHLFDRGGCGGAVGRDVRLDEPPPQLERLDLLGLGIGKPVSKRTARGSASKQVMRARKKVLIGERNIYVISRWLHCIPPEPQRRGSGS